jgi:hypothetical protein
LYFSFTNVMVHEGVKHAVDRARADRVREQVTALSQEDLKARGY